MFKLPSAFKLVFYRYYTFCFVCVLTDSFSQLKTSKSFFRFNLKCYRWVLSPLFFNPFFPFFVLFV